MDIIKRLAGKRRRDQAEEKRPWKLEQVPVPVSKPATERGYDVASTSALEDLRDATLVKCILAGYSNEKTRACYTNEVKYAELDGDLVPLTNPRETPYHAYQRAQTRRCAPYVDIVREMDPRSHRLEADKNYESLLIRERSEGYENLPIELETWRLAWLDVVQTLEADSKALREAGDLSQAVHLERHSHNIKLQLLTITDDEMSREILQQLDQSITYERELERFEAGAHQRRATVASRKGPRRDAGGYKNTQAIIARGVNTDDLTTGTKLEPEVARTVE